jgi:hypothetical protein
MAFRYAVATGNFSNGAIWDNGAVPTSADDLYANAFTVTINGTYTVQTIRNTVSPVSVPNIATPIMTAPSLPSGIASASSFNTDEAWKAFTQSTTDRWLSGTLNTGWLSYQFPTTKIIKRYVIKSITTNNNCPKTFTFEGSNDGISWTILQTVTDALMTITSPYVSPILANTTPYLYYRINITAVNLVGNAPVIQEFEMTESTGTVLGNSTGGQFIYANGGNLTTTASTGIIPGIASVPVLEMTLASPNTATFNGSVLTVPNISNALVIRNSGTGTLNCNGNYNLDNTFGTRSIISVTSTGNVNIVGDVSSTLTGVGTNTNCILMSAAGIINITGNVTASTNTAFSSCPIDVRSGILNITGNTTANITPAIYLAGPVTYNQIGNVNASTVQPAIFNLTSAATISVTGIITANTGSPAIYSSFALTGNYSSGTFVKVSGNVVNNSNIMAIVAPRVTIDTNTSSWLFQISTGGNRTLYAAGVALGNPAIGDVRLGTVYGASSELTGTLAMPIPATVLLGVLTDATTGTLLMTPADFWNYLISSGFTVDSIGDRLQNAATVATTGGQIASYNI